MIKERMFTPLELSGRRDGPGEEQRYPYAPMRFLTTRNPLRGRGVLLVRVD